MENVKKQIIGELHNDQIQIRIIVFRPKIYTCIVYLSNKGSAANMVYLQIS